MIIHLSLTDTLGGHLPWDRTAGVRHLCAGATGDTERICLLAEAYILLYRRVGYVLDLFVIVRGLPVRHFVGERPLAFAVWPDEHA